MAIQYMSRADAAKFVQANPNARIMNQPQQQQQDPGLIGGLLQSLTSPFRQTLGAGFNILKDAGTGFQTPLQDMFKEQNPFMSQEESQNYIANPLLGGLKSGAGIGAFAVPGLGEGLGGAIGTGALAGGLGGFGMSKPGEELSGTALGAATGGALGGATHGILGMLGGGDGKLSSLGENLQNKGEGMQLDVLGTKAYKNMGPNFAAIENEDKQLISDALNRTPGKNGALGQKYNPEGFGKAFQNLGVERRALLANNPTSLTIQDIIDKAAPKLSESSSLTLPEAQEKIREALTSTDAFRRNTGNLSHEAILNNQVPLDQFDLQDIASQHVKDAMKVGKADSALKAPIETNAAIHNAITDHLSNIQGYGDINRSFSAFYRQSPGLISVENASGLKSPTPRAIKTQVFKGAQYGAGGLLRKVGGVLQGTGGISLPSGLGQTLGRIGTIGAATQAPGLLNPQQGAQQGSQDNQSVLGLNNQSSFEDQANQNQAHINQVTQDLLNRGVKPAQIKTYLSLMGINSKPLGARQASQLGTNQSAMDQAQQLMSDIQSQSGEFGPVNGGAPGNALQSVLGIVGAGSPDRAGLQQELVTTGQMLNKALGVSGVKQTEMPQLSDNPQVAQRKLQNLYNLVQQRNQSLINSYQAAGYNPYSGADQVLGYGQ